MNLLELLYIDELVCIPVIARSQLLVVVGLKGYVLFISRLKCVVKSDESFSTDMIISDIGRFQTPAIESVKRFVPSPLVVEGKGINVTAVRCIGLELSFILDPLVASFCRTFSRKN